MQTTPRCALIHDLSGFGRCSLTIIIPVLSAMGVQCCPLPTAYLSTHTAFPGNSFLDMTESMAAAADHWATLNIDFRAIYSGFMSSLRQIDLTADFVRTFRRENTQVIVDPVMGDHGRPYRTYTPELCTAMGKLADLADMITPNLTEASILLDEPYDESLTTNEAACCRLVERLSREGSRSVVLTGVSIEPGQTGSACFDKMSGNISIVQVPLVDRAFHGTGDLFAAVLTGSLLRNCSLTDAAQRAADFARTCVAHTLEQDLPPREGVDFEPLLWQLGRSVLN